MKSPYLTHKKSKDAQSILTGTYMRQAVAQTEVQRPDNHLWRQDLELSEVDTGPEM